MSTRPEDVPQARGLMSEDIPDPLARGYRHMRGGWPGIAASSRHCPVCLADHSDITTGQACPEHGHLLQLWAGALECPAARCAYSRPVSPNA